MFITNLLVDLVADRVNLGKLNYSVLNGYVFNRDIVVYTYNYTFVDRKLYVKFSYILGMPKLLIVYVNV